MRQHPSIFSHPLLSKEISQTPLLFAHWLTSSKYYLAAHLVLSSCTHIVLCPGVSHVSISTVWRAISFCLIWTWVLPPLFSPKFLYWRKWLVSIHLLQTLMFVSLAICLNHLFSRLNSSSSFSLSVGVCFLGSFNQNCYLEHQHESH